MAWSIIGKQGRVSTEPIENHTELSGQSDVEGTIVGLLQYQKLRSALEQLPDDQAKVIMLRFVSGLSSKETAQAMGKTVSSIKTKKFRAVSKLRELLSGEIDE